MQLTADRVDLKAGTLVFESLKKRRRGVYRPVPVPPAFLDTSTWSMILAPSQSVATGGPSI